MPKSANRYRPGHDKVKGGGKDRPFQHLYGARWQRERLLHLDEHPLCVVCLAEGRTEVATVVDHIIPHRGDEELFNNPTNLQSLCERHHNQKTRRGE